jgi:phage-related protein
VHKPQRPDPWAVVFYETANGDRPAEMWLREQHVKVQARFAWILDLLEEHGTNVREPYVAHLRGKLWEVRLVHQRVQYRIVYLPASRRRFVMLHGFVKKTQRTPARELETAEQRMRDYVQRRAEEG